MININLPPLTTDALRSILEWLDDRRITKQDLAALKAEIMHTLQECLDKVEANTTVVGSLNTLVDGIRIRLQEILAGTVIVPAVQAQIDELFDKLAAQETALAETVLENTGVVPPPNPTP